MTLLFLELFVSVSLTVNFFYLVRSQGAPKPDGNMFAAQTFWYLSKGLGPILDVVPVAWRTRLAGPVVSAWLLESQISPAEFAALKEKSGTFGNLCRSTEFQNIFGFYHSAWLFLTFLALILFRRDALLIVLGVFAGLMFNLTGPAGAYYYPWDMPALFFFTLACLLFDRGRIGLLLPVLVVGGLFKETVLCCALLVLLGGHWDWKRRWIAFLAVIAAVWGANRLLMAHYDAFGHMNPTNTAAGTPGWLPGSLFFENINLLFGTHVYEVVFANAGALLLLVLLPWRNRRDLLFKVVALVFAVGQFFYGVISEVRIWYELLPLGWILISETVTRWWGKGEADSPSQPGCGPKVVHWMLLALLAVALSGLFVVGKFVHRVVPQAGAGGLQETMAAAERGDVVAAFNLGRRFESQVNYPAAVGWYEKAAAGGNVEAQYNLGVIYWEGKLGKPDPARAVRLFHEAGRQGNVYADWALGNIYWHGHGGVQPDLMEAYKWLKLAQINGFREAAGALNSCAAGMSPEQVAEAEKRVKAFPDAGN